MMESTQCFVCRMVQSIESARETFACNVTLSDPKVSDVIDVRVLLRAIAEIEMSVLDLMEACALFLCSE